MTTQLTTRPGTPAPPPTPPAAPTGNRRLDIQGLRAIAVLLVVAFHAELPLPGGFVGVDVFFVISGFVITAMLVREQARWGRLRFGHFYLRRFLRLTPALAVLVAVVALLSLVLQNPFGAQQTTARTGLGAMLLSANYVIGHAAGDYFASDAKTNPLLNTWSLSVEEQFYLLFPALLVLGWMLARRRASAPVVVVSAIAGGSFALSIAWSYGSTLLEPLTSYFGGATSFAFYSSLTRAWEFAVGALLVLLAHRLPALTRTRAHVLGAAGALLIVAAALLIHDDQPFPGLAALVPVVGTLLLLHAGTHGGGVSVVLSTRPMVAIGDLSYSWYLWHWPLIVFAALLVPNEPVVLVIAAIASLLPSWLSYRLVEQPLRRYRPATRVRASAVIATTLAVPIALCVALLAGANAGWGLVPRDSASGIPATTPVSASVVEPSGAPDGSTTDAAPADVAPTDAGDGEVAGGEGGSLRAQHAVVKAGCVNNGFDPESCRFGPVDARGTVLLAGDSQAYAVADGVIDAAARQGLDTVATSRTGCPLLDRESSGVHNYPCRSWQQEVVAWALAERPSVVVLANRSGGYVRPAKQWRTVARDDGSAATSVDEAAQLYQRGLEPVVAELSEAGIPVVIVAAVPEMPGYTNQTSLLGQAFGSRAFEIPRSDAESDRRPALDVEQRLAAAYDGVEVLDPIPALCSDTTCSTDRDGEPTYQDETHLSLTGSMLLADRFADAISRATIAGAPQPR